MARKIQANDYRKLEQREHIYYIPDTYIGSAARMSRNIKAYDLDTDKMLTINTDIPEGLEHLFLEIISNAADACSRSMRLGIDPGPIIVNMKGGIINVINGGMPIPIDINTQTGLYAPEMIFGVLLTSNNYTFDKGEDACRLDCGRNGYGAKLTNIFSKQFRVEVADADRGLYYVQEWQNNMQTKSNAVITQYNGRSFVSVTYIADLERFGYTEYPPEFMNVILRRSMDISLVCKVPIVFNGITYDCSDITQYAKKYFGTNNDSITLFMHQNGVPLTDEEFAAGVRPALELCLVDTPDSGHAISFVNGACTTDGGVHVDGCYSMIKFAIFEVMNGVSKGKSKSKKKKNEDEAKSAKLKEINLTIADVKAHVSILLTARLPNPEFRGQAKAFLSKPACIGSPDKLDKTPLKSMKNWFLISRLYAAIDAKDYDKIIMEQKKRGRHSNVEKLNDANKAGTREGYKCTLIVTEGDSASGYPLLYRTRIENGVDWFGILPLRGKIPNVRNMSVADLLKQYQEGILGKISDSIGLRENIDYSNDEEFMTLRYGRILICSDADDDGKHINALVVNYICRYPSLVARGFIWLLRTPIIRVMKGRICYRFLSNSEYEMWKNSTPDHASYSLKYYKGLAKAVGDDVDRDYDDRDRCNIMCLYDDAAETALKLAFDRKLADVRKDWMLTWKQSVIVEDLRQLPISTMITEELIQYSLANIERSIPGMDGLKQSQRKIIYGASVLWSSSGKKTFMVKPEDTLINVLNGEVMKSTAYHHGESSVYKTVIWMGQSYVGSNNLPLFKHGGFFGSRNDCGKDHGEPRYLETAPTNIMNYIFRAEDEPILTKQLYNGKQIEYKFYLPVVPIEVINGCTGVGSGWSTSIPPHSPLDVANWFIQHLKTGEPPEAIMPSYKGFKGTVEITIKERKKKVEEVKPQKEEESIFHFVTDDNAESDSDDDDQIELVEGEEEEDQEKIRKILERKSSVSLVTKGVYEKVGNKIYVSELPIGMSALEYTEKLKKMVTDQKIINYENRCEFKDQDDDKINFVITGFQGSGYRDLHLVKSFGLTNIVKLNQDMKPVKYKSVRGLMHDYYLWRLPFYDKRKQYILDNIKDVIIKKQYKIKFISLVLDGSIVINRRKKADIINDMTKYDIPSEIFTKSSLQSLSEDDIVELEDEIRKLQEEYETLANTTPQQLWIKDLEEFITNLPV